MKEGKYIYPDDDVFLIVRGDGARLLQLDLSIHAGTEKPRKLLKNDGTIVTEVVKSVRVATPSAAKQNATFENGARFSNREVVSERQRRARHGLHGRHRSLLEQQFTALPLADDHRPYLGDGDGRSLFHSRQRDSL